jgi:PIN domain nuclease of toxin-antitoxin system
VTALPSGRVLLDASLLVGVAERHASAVRFVPRLRGAVATSINFGEVLYLLSQRAGTPVAATEQMFVSVLGVKVEPVDAAVVRHFPELKRIDAVSRAAQTAAGAHQVKSLSLADMTCLAYAMEHTLPVLTGDKHWTTLHRHGLAPSVFDFRDRSLTP